MLKNAKKLFSAILSLALAAGAVFALPASAQEAADVNPQEHMQLISSCSKLTSKNTTKKTLTDKTPDGIGYSLKIVSGNSNFSENIYSDELENPVTVTKDTLEKGAFVIWSGHNENRISENGEAEKAYIRSIFMFRYDNNRAYDMNLMTSVPIYFISSADGTVICNKTTNTATGLAKDTDGNYYNEGYWVIPGSSLNLSKFTDDSEHTLSLVSCNSQSMNAACNSLVKVGADFECYYDNLCFVDNIEDILGSKTDGTFAYDAGSTYPVYKLGYMTGKNGVEPNISAEGGSVTASELPEGAILNAYNSSNVFVASAASENGKAVIDGLATGSYTLQTAEKAENGRYANASEYYTLPIASVDLSNLHYIRDYTDLTPYDPVTGDGNGTDNVPDGKGFIDRTVSKTYTERTHSSFYNESISSDAVNNGALMFYFKHSETRTVDGQTEKAYADIIPSIVLKREEDEGNTVVSINASAVDKKSVYFISSQDGTVIKNSTYNSSVQLAESGGNYYNSGWWIVPLSALKVSQGTSDTLGKSIIELGEEYMIRMIKFNCRNIAPLTANNTKAADCTFYLDNFAIVDNIEDILGAKNSNGNYAFDNGSVYPVYNFGALDVPEGTAALDKSECVARSAESITVKRPEEYNGAEWTVNVYLGGELKESVKPGKEKSALTLSGYGSQTVRVQLICGGKTIPVALLNRAGDINDDGLIDIRDLVGGKKLTVRTGNTYNSDINGDGNTDAYDLAKLRKMLLG